MLLEVFHCIKPLIFSFQKSQGSICLTDAQSYVHISMQNLELLKTESTRNYFTSENIKKLQTVAAEELLNMPLSSRLQGQSFSFEYYKDNIFSTFIEAFKEELGIAFSQMSFWTKFSIFDPRKLPEDLASLPTYGLADLELPLEHYGNHQSSTFKGKVVDQEPMGYGKCRVAEL